MADEEEKRLTGVIRAICISEQRGTKKREIPSAVLVEGFGIEGDAHGGSWHRQISLLSFEKIEQFREKGTAVAFGDFGENLVVEGIDFRELPVGSWFQCKEAVLELTQIGKECHSHCAIYQQTGDCIMPREGVFARVLKGGAIRSGDEITILGLPAGRPFRAAVITLSDRAFQGERNDQSGPLAAAILKEAGYLVEETLLLSDETSKLKGELVRLADARQVDLIITTGGTGFSERDITPEATEAVAKRRAPGIAEAIRGFSLTHTKRAMLSRGVSVIRGRTLIVNLPGSPGAVKECLAFILPVLEHGLLLLRGEKADF